MVSTTVDIDALLGANTRSKPGGRCYVGDALARLDPDTAAKVRDALADRGRYTATGLAAVFSQLGEPVSRSPLERHRRGDCQCPK